VKPLVTLFLCLGLVGSAFAQNGYITNAGSNNVSVIDTRFAFGAPRRCPILPQL
jgi:hypothetical protein